MPSITLTLSIPEANRLLKALGAHQHLERDATATEVKAWLVRQLSSVVTVQERRLSEGALPTPPPLVIT